MILLELIKIDVIKNDIKVTEGTIENIIKIDMTIRGMIECDIMIKDIIGNDFIKIDYIT